MPVATRRLAVNGGTPVRHTERPEWPGRHESAAAAVRTALSGNRWTMTGPSDGTPTVEQRFAAQFARWNGVEHCVTADHGTSALVMALEALGIGYGDEVVVPVFTWVASATAVLRVNARPVFVDVDPQTGCMLPDAVEAAITPRTTAVVAVHLHWLMSDVDRLGEICRRHGVALVEDAAQAHGAVWRGRRAGTIGDIGAFSLHQSKVLAAGEGGAVVTSDATAHRLLQQLRSDSSVYLEDVPRDAFHLEAKGEIMGTNYAMTEMAAAIALDRLSTLDSEVDTRDRNARHLNTRLAEVPGLRPLGIPVQQDRVSVFEYAIARDSEAFAGRPTDVVCRAVGRELGLDVYRPDPPLDRSVRYRPGTKAAWRHVDLPVPTGPFPIAHRLHEQLMLVHHPALLGDRVAMDEIVEAFAKVSEHADELPADRGER